MNKRFYRIGNFCLNLYLVVSEAIEARIFSDIFLVLLSQRVAVINVAVAHDAIVGERLVILNAPNVVTVASFIRSSVDLKKVISLKRLSFTLQGFVFM